MKGMLFAALSLAASPAVASGLAPDLPAEVHFAALPVTANDWQLLLRRIGKDGQFFERSGDIAARFELKNIRGPEHAPHRADYIDIWGDIDRENRFYPGFVRLVSEDWRPFKPSDTQDQKTRERCSKETCLFIDQWIFTLDVDGPIMDFLHDATIENVGMDIVESQYFRPTDEQGKKMLGSLLSEWYQFRPKPPAHD